jgi:hypothetical protein
MDRIGTATEAGERASVSGAGATTTGNASPPDVEGAREGVAV